MDLEKEIVYVPGNSRVMNIAQVHALRALDMQARLEGYDSRKDFLAEHKKLDISYHQSALNALHGVHTNDYLDARVQDEMKVLGVEVAAEIEAEIAAEKRVSKNIWGIRAAGLAAAVLLAVTAQCYDQNPSQTSQYTMTEIDDNSTLLLP
jgi:hypothetical protein